MAGGKEAPAPFEGACTPAMIEKVAFAVSSGMGWAEAARACGIGVRTLRDWRHRGQTDPKSRYGTLVKRLEQAEAEFERTHLETIAAASKKSWQAAAWLLERTRPERYALIKRVETGPPGAFDHLDDKELNATILELVPRRHPKRKKGDSGSGSSGAPAAE